MLFIWSWRKESNLQPADYKSAALPLSHASKRRIGGQGWIRTIEDIVDGFTVRCIWPLCNLPKSLKTKSYFSTNILACLMILFLAFPKNMIIFENFK